MSAAIDSLLSHEADKAKKAESKNEENKMDPDMLLAMELQREEFEENPKPKMAPKKTKTVPQESTVEGKQYIFAHAKPVGTFVCMYPELLLKEDIPYSIFSSKSSPKSENKKDIEALSPEEFENPI